MVSAASDPTTGQLLVPVPSGTHRLTVRFTRTWDRTVGGIVSILFLVMILAFMFATRRGVAASKY
jgi:hypothetical protein